MEQSFLTTKISEIVAWGRKYSLWPMPFGTACCAIEFMGTVSNMFDISRFGAELVRFSPRQSDLLLVLGTINYKQAAILKKIYQQMAEPRYVIAVGACATCGGFYDNYAVLQGIDEVIPVDVYVPGCPPRPEQILLAVVKLQEKLVAEAKGKTATDQLRAKPQILESAKHPEFKGTFVPGSLVPADTGKEQK